MTLLIVMGGYAWMYWFRSTKAEDKSETKLQGRTLRGWSSEVEMEGTPDPAFEVLVSAGLSVISNLSAIILGPESLKDLMLRLPNSAVPLNKKYLDSDTSEVLRQKARAAYIWGTIAYRYPNAPEVQAAVPSLVSARRGGSPIVRYSSAQALGAVGQRASNAVTALIAVATDDDPSLRMCAVEAIGRIGVNTPASLDAITQGLSDPNSDVRATAMRGAQMFEQSAHKPTRNP